MAHPVGHQGGWPSNSYGRPRYSDEMEMPIYVNGRPFYSDEIVEIWDNVEHFLSIAKEEIERRVMAIVDRYPDGSISEQASVKYDDNDDYVLDKPTPFTLPESNENDDLEIISYVSSNDGYDEYDNDYALEKSTHFMLPESDEDVDLETLSCMSSENDYYSVVNDFDEEKTEYNVTSVDEENVGFKIENFDRENVDYYVVNYDGKVPNFYIDNFDIENLGKRKEDVYANYGVKNDSENVNVNYFDEFDTDYGVNKFYGNYYVNEWIQRTYNFREIGDNRSQNLIYDHQN